MLSLVEVVIVSLAAPAFLLIIKYYLDQRKAAAAPKKLAGEMKNKASFVYAIMDRLSDRFRPHWLELVQFHNGSVYLGGGSAQKFSVRFEVVRDAEPLASRFQSIPIENFYKAKSLIIENKRLEAPNISALPDKFRRILKSVDVASFYAIAIEKNGAVIGYVALMYQTPTTIAADDIEFINLQVSRLGEYL